MNLDDDVDFDDLAAITIEMSGAQIETICTQARINAIRERNTSVSHLDFEMAINELVKE